MDNTSESQESTHQSSPRWLSRRSLVGFLLLLILSGGGLYLWLNGSPSAAELLTEAREALQARRYERAETLCRQALELEPDSGRGLMLAARAAEKGRGRAAALDYLDRLAADSETARELLFQGAGWALELGQATRAEQLLRRLLAAEPTHLEGCNQLAYLLGFEGRCFAAVPYLLEPVRQRKFSPHHLVLLGAAEPVIEDAPLRERCLQAVPDDPLPQLGAARSALSRDDLDTAKEMLLSPLFREHPDPEVQARVGLCLLRVAPGEIPDWNRRLPASAAGHPDIWAVRGRHVAERNDRPAAIRCYWEAVRLAPNHLSANYQLGQLLAQSGQEEQARPFLTRADRLRELVLLIDKLYADPASAELMEQAAGLMEQLGRHWEAIGWAQLALNLHPQLEWPRAVLDRLPGGLSPETPQVLATHHPALQQDCSSYPLPHWPEQRASGTNPGEIVNNPASIRFRDDAPISGVTFTYRNGQSADSTEIAMLQTTGGGVAVLDYDQDGWPDLYFTQGGMPPHDQEHAEHRDALFRNLGNGRFEETTQAAGLGDACYSQGVAVGDIDNDGFPDLFVANFGRNRLYRNNGDGTFAEISDGAGLQDKLWTTSGLLADLNGDGLPDLYEVNYLQPEEAINSTCRRGNEVVWCNPSRFQAEDDQLHLNNGDGTFRNVTTESGIRVPQGKGLGIVAAAWDQSGQLGLFVANDAEPNFFFQQEALDPTGIPRYQEQALLYGLAVDAGGLPQACMGVAAGDPNGNGLLDLFITNFSAQSNTLYDQQSELLFLDNTIQANLRDSSFAMLGFGTQFLDADLDGWEDLILTNGHVYDRSYAGEAFQMPPQFYRNLGQGRFRELPPADLGPFFDGKYLGRGLARLDWNRDGRDDAAISHMNSAAALLTNLTPAPGHYLRVKLVGVTGSRDAIGAIVRLKTGERTLVRQMTAGDGYQASNERVLTFGLGAASTVDELEIRWLNGTVQTARNLPADRTLLWVEGASPRPIP